MNRRNATGHNFFPETFLCGSSTGTGWLGGAMARPVGLTPTERWPGQQWPPANPAGGWTLAAVEDVVGITVGSGICHEHHAAECQTFAATQPQECGGKRIEHGQRHEICDQPARQLRVPNS
jgi:hypothetical protein